MAASIENTASYNNSLQREHSSAGLKKAKALEEKRKRNGWRYVKITPTTQILVPCNKDGSITEIGQERIDRFKRRNGYK